MHYGGNDGTHADDNKDSQLPCQNLQHNTLSVVCFKIQNTPILEVVTTYNTKVLVRGLLSNLPQGHVFLVFQPPKMG